MKCAISALGLCLALAAPAGAETTLRVMSFNIWGGGVNEDKGVEETVAAIRASGADIVGLQETRAEPEDCTAESCAAVGPSAAQAIAEALGWQYHDQTQENEALWANAVISRYPSARAAPSTWGWRSTSTAARSGSSTSISMTNPISLIS